MEDRASARLRVLFGQPVKLGGASFGVIRIALGADMLIDAFCSGNAPLAEENVAAMGANGGEARLLAQVISSLRSCLELGLVVRLSSFRLLSSDTYSTALVPQHTECEIYMEYADMVLPYSSTPRSIMNNTFCTSEHTAKHYTPYSDADAVTCEDRPRMFARYTE